MNKNMWVRQSHRWLSIAFTLTVIINFAVLGQDAATRQQVAYLPLLPLAFLLFSGLYLFALPYVTKGRGGRTQVTEGRHAGINSTGE